MENDDGNMLENSEEEVNNPKSYQNTLTMRQTFFIIDCCQNVQNKVKTFKKIKKQNKRISKENDILKNELTSSKNIVKIQKRNVQDLKSKLINLKRESDKIV